MVFLLQASRASKHVAIVFHRLRLFGPLALLRITQHKLAVFRIATELVTSQTRLCADLGPNLVEEEVIGHRRRQQATVLLRFFSTRISREEHQRQERD